MPYASINDVKAWLIIPPNDTRDDAEISAILSVVDEEIRIMISRYSDIIPESDPIIAMYEALWAAGIYRMRREKMNDVHPFIKYARERLIEYICGKYGGKVRIA
ncbi:MAG: hypothetical protein QW692_00675 [Nitrososphaerota archaeon]